MIKIKLEEIALGLLVLAGLSRRPQEQPQPQPTPSPPVQQPPQKPELPYPPGFIGIPPHEIPIPPERPKPKPRPQLPPVEQPHLPIPRPRPPIYHRPTPAPPEKPPIEQPIPQPPYEIPPPRRRPPRRPQIPPELQQPPEQPPEEQPKPQPPPKIPSPRPPELTPRPPPPFRNIGEGEEQKVKYGIHDHTITFKINVIDYKGKPTPATMVVIHPKYGELLRVELKGGVQVVTAQLNPNVPEQCYFSKVIKKIIPKNPELKTISVEQVGLALGAKYVIPPDTSNFKVLKTIPSINTTIAVDKNNTIWIYGKSMPGYVVTYMVLDSTRKLLDVGQAKAWEEWADSFWVKTWAKYQPGIIVKVRNYDKTVEVQL